MEVAPPLPHLVQVYELTQYRRACIVENITDSESSEKKRSFVLRNSSLNVKESQAWQVEGYF
jgi:hypothetical protein